MVDYMIQIINITNLTEISNKHVCIRNSNSCTKIFSTPENIKKACRISVKHVVVVTSNIVA